MRPVAGGVAQRVDDQGALDLGHGPADQARPGRPVPAQRRRRAMPGWMSMGLDAVAAGQHHRAMQAILQLAHIAAPRLGREPIQRCRAERPLGQAVQPGELGGQVPGQRHDILRALAQGRQLQGQHTEPEQQILAERAFRDCPLEVAVAGGDQPDIDANRPRAADAIDLALLDGAQQLGLQPRLHLADLVEQQRAAIGLLEPADAAGHGTGEGAALVPEQLGFEQVFGDGRTVDRDERATGATAVAMHEACDHLLAGAALAGDQHAGLGRSELPCTAQDRGHARVGADQLVPVLADRGQDGRDQLGFRGQRQELARAGPDGRCGQLGRTIDAVGHDRQEHPLLRQPVDGQADIGCGVEEQQVGAMPAAQLVHGGGERFHVPDLRAAGRRQAHRRNDLRASAADDHEAHTAPPPVTDMLSRPSRSRSW